MLTNLCRILGMNPEKKSSPKSYFYKPPIKKAASLSRRKERLVPNNVKLKLTICIGPLLVKKFYCSTSLKHIHIKESTNYEFGCVNFHKTTKLFIIWMLRYFPTSVDCWVVLPFSYFQMSLLYKKLSLPDPNSVTQSKL